MGTISDLAILNTASNDEVFASALAKDAPWGFSPWQAFTQGDYSFREVLLRLKVKKNIDAATVHVREHVLSYDMEDMHESRQVDVAAEDTLITFDKPFHSVPQVHVTTFVTPEFCVPQVGEVTKDSFTVRLVKQNGELTGGRISYNAQGY
jgi:hypothetical protein